jgi:hypothetical protein
MEVTSTSDYTGPNPFYSIVLNAHRDTSMADTDIDAVRTEKKAEYDKQYRLKRKLLL